MATRSRCQALVFKVNKYGTTGPHRRRCLKAQKQVIECRDVYTIHVGVCDDPTCHRAARAGHRTN